MIYKMKLADSVDEMIFDLLEVPIEDKDIEGTADNTTIDGNVFTDYLWLKKQFVQKWSLMCEDDYTQLRGFYTRQWENAEVPTYKLFYGEDISSTDTASGNPISLTNSTDYDAPILDFEMQGNAEQTSPLPSTYQAVDYIQSSGVQYIDTGLKFGAFDKIETRFEETSYYSSYPKLYGLESGSNTEALKLDIRNAQWRIGINNVESQIGNYALNTVYTHTIEYTSNSYFYAYMNGNEVLERTSNTTVSTAYNMFIFASNRAGNATENSAVKLYTFKMYKSGALVRNFIPCYRKSDGVIGLYDIIGKTFYTNASSSTTPFAKGSDTTLPTPDYPLPISVVTGENVVKITGKNLVNVVAENEITYSGYTNFTLSDGVITTTGNTLTGFKTRVLPNTQYTAQVYATGTGGTKVLRVREYSTEPTDWTTGFIQQTQESATANVKTSKSLTTSATTTWVLVCVYADASGIGFKDIQLELGATATSYEPYQGQDYEVNLGKNLSTVASKDNVAWADGSDELRDVLNSLPVGTYTISMVYTLTQRNDTSDASTFGVYLPNSGGNLQKNNVPWGNVGVGSSKEFVFTIDITSARKGNFSNFQFYGCGITGTGTTGTANVTSIQIEKGSTATTYAPYFTPIELAKIGTYQDRIYKNDGKWYVEKQIDKLLLDGSETWAAPAVRTNTCRTQVNNIANNQARLSRSALSMSIYFEGKDIYTSDQVGLMMHYPTADSYGRVYVSYPISIGTTESNWTTWLTEHPFYVYYPLATPTTTEITEQALIDQLEAIVSANLPQGAVNISLTGTGAQGSMVVEYELIISKETIIKDTTPVRLTLTDGGVINPCGCRQNVQLTMRETIQ